ncbi:acyl-CoA dehydrogenase family protein [Mucilaginibacter sp. CSA2-8R]|uniref:acyl-CoA dehydrogenase family protein n=1 Tax=Mucilaginibacter sp. CSA2-8R TaxID=3141542 RepID=UPI00315DC61D
MFLPATQTLTPEQAFQFIAQNASSVDYDGAFPKEEFDKLREARLMSISLPDQPLDSSKKHTAKLLQLLKAIGKASLPVGRVYEGHINALLLIELYGNQQQQQQWFADATEQHLFGVWNTQAQDGVKIHDLGQGRYRLEGCKTFCSGAGQVTRPVITADWISPERKGWQMCVLPMERLAQPTIDREFWKPLGMRASASFKVDFTGLEITDDELLGLPNAYYQQPYFSGGAIRFAAVQLGGAEAVLIATHALLRQMNRTDDAFQRARVAEMTYLIESGNLWLKQAGKKTDRWLKQPEATEKLLAYANMTRTVIEDICLRCMQLAERSVGSRGLIRPQALERIHRDLTTYLRQPAPDATLVAIGEYVLKQENTNQLWHAAK